MVPNYFSCESNLRFLILLLINSPTFQLGQKRATVARPRSCTLCRECIRGDDWEKLVAVRRVKDHFICKYKFENGEISLNPVAAIL